MTHLAHWSSWFRAVRWLGASDTLQAQARNCNLLCSINRTTFLLWERVHFTVTGDRDDVRRFGEWWDRWRRANGDES